MRERERMIETDVGWGVRERERETKIKTERD